MSDQKVLVVIPARGGSKGIPRKNIRPLAGKPLIYYAIRNALKAGKNVDVYVSSDDQEILYIAKQFGSKVHFRDPKLAEDKTTLDPVIFDTLQYAEKAESKNYDVVVTLQPTSPLLSSQSLKGALVQIEKEETVDTIISSVDDTHLTWREEDGRFLPNYVKRVNRQYLQKNYKETGGFLIARRSIVTESSRIGKNTTLFVLNAKEGIDIDTYEDWNLCEYYMQRKKVVFCVSGYQEIGLGHVYNCLLLASEILNHEIHFLVDKQSDLAYEKIKGSFFPVSIQQSDNILDDIKSLKPDVVVSDRLDTTKEYVLGVKALGVSTVNIEDLGDGSHFADLVFNAIYPDTISKENMFFGPKYFCARDEFLVSDPIKIKPKIKQVLVTFGGVDPNNLTKKVLDVIMPFCDKENIAIKVITGLGYKNGDSLKAYTNIDVLSNVNNIAEAMAQADLAFTSAGRTTYELAIMGVPSIVLAQNDRELTHFFAYEENGFVNLGLGKEATSSTIAEKFQLVVSSFEKRKEMQRLMMGTSIREGKKRVIKKINDLINDYAAK